MRLDPNSSIDNTAAWSDPHVTSIDGDADYQADISRDGGRTWGADAHVTDTVCGGHVQIEVVDALFGGAEITANGPVRTLANDDGTLTRWTPTR